MALVEKAFGDIITFTRASGGGRINALGQYEWVAANVPRLTHDPVTLQPLGLLVEEQRTNLLLQSGNPALAPWTNDSATLGPPAAGPLGNETPVYETAVSGFFRVRQQASSVVAGVAYTYKFNIKKLGRRYLFIRTQARTLGNENIGFDLDTLTTTFVPAGWTASIRIVSPGIYQLTATCTALTTNGVVHGVLASNAPITTNTLPNYVGDPAQGFVYVSGQFEAGASPSSDIPTEGSQVIRAADVPVVNTLAPWYNASEGTLEIMADTGAGATPHYASFLTSTGSSYEGLRAFRQTSTGTDRLAFRDAGGPDVIINSAAITSKKRAMSYKVGGDVAICADGGAVSKTSIAAESTPAITRLFIGSLNGGSLFHNGIIESITYHPRVTDTQQASA